MNPLSKAMKEIRDDFNRQSKEEAEKKAAYHSSLERLAELIDQLDIAERSIIDYTMENQRLTIVSSAQPDYKLVRFERAGGTIHVTYPSQFNMPKQTFQNNWLERMTEVAARVIENTRAGFPLDHKRKKAVRDIVV
ncbi:hypothetical protein ACUXV3_12325 [Roseobacteraceae bacterium NS-SX3]